MFLVIVNDESSLRNDRSLACVATNRLKVYTWECFWNDSQQDVGHSSNPVSACCYFWCLPTVRTLPGRFHRSCGSALRCVFSTLIKQQLQPCKTASWRKSTNESGVPRISCVQEQVWNVLSDTALPRRDSRVPARSQLCKGKGSLETSVVLNHAALEVEEKQHEATLGLFLIKVMVIMRVMFAERRGLHFHSSRVCAVLASCEWLGGERENVRCVNDLLTLLLAWLTCSPSSLASANLWRIWNLYSKIAKKKFYELRDLQLLSYNG